MPAFVRRRREAYLREGALELDRSVTLNPLHNVSWQLCNGFASECRTWTTDNHVDSALVGKSPSFVIEALRKAGLEYDGKRHAGVVLHLMGAIKEHGKVGFTAIGDSPREAKALFQRAERVLRQATAAK